MAVLRVFALALLDAGGAKTSSRAFLVAKGAAPTRSAETGAGHGVAIGAVAAVASFLALFSVCSFAAHFIASPANETGLASASTFNRVADRLVLAIASLHAVEAVSSLRAAFIAVPSVPTGETSAFSTNGRAASSF